MVVRSRLVGFEWAQLPAKSVIVDVGGGIGTVTMDLAVQHGRLRYVVQDLPGVIAQAEQVSTMMADAIVQQSSLTEGPASSGEQRCQSCCATTPSGSKVCFFLLRRRGAC